MRDDKICRLTRHILSPQRVCTIAAHFVSRRQIVHGGDEMCRQSRYNLSPETNCAGATKYAVTHPENLKSYNRVVEFILRNAKFYSRQNLLIYSNQSTCTITLTVTVTTIDVQWEGMGDVGSARYEPALLPPCPTIRVLSYSN